MGWVSAAMAVVGAVKQRKAGKEAQKMAEYNAQAKEAETAEAARRLSKTQEQTKAVARARAMASGVKVDASSTGDYLESMADEMATELDWLRKTGASEAEVTRLEGKYNRQQQSMKALSTAGSGLVKWGESSNWWGLG